MDTVTIIDDDDQLRKSFCKLLTSEGYRVQSAASGEAGIALVTETLPDLVVLDMRLPGINGFETFKRIHEMDPKLPVIIMTAFGTTQTAIEATKLGAFDYIIKPFDIPDMLKIIKKGLEAGRFMRLPVALNSPPERASADAIIGSSPPMQEVYKAIGRVAPTDATVLIRGESGTGKELAARAIYQHSRRSSRPFLVINCVAIPETLLESELFGYEKGSFTGATHRRVGKLEQAGGGTVFLDEIGDMPLTLQAKILRLLQERSIERLGGRETIPVDVRIIAATNRNLEAGIQSGAFREDLYFRLKVVTILLPPLRERKADIPALTGYFLGRHAADNRVDNPGITPAAVAHLAQYDWPGNVRELSNVLQKALIFKQGGPLSVEDIARALGQPQAAARTGEGPADRPLPAFIRQWIQHYSGEQLFDDCLDEVADRLIREVLAMSNGNRSKAAKLLGLSRPTLHAKIEKFGLKIETAVSDSR